MQLQQTKDYATAIQDFNQFYKLLDWLDNDRESAGQKYKTIHQKLTRIFYARGAHAAEELADETIERVTKKIDDLTDNYVGEPMLYFYGVAKNVFLEFTRKPVDKELPNSISQEVFSDDQSEQLDIYLTKCLNSLSSEDSEFIIEYYKKDKQEKINHRKQMAKDLGITMRALRVRAFRIRKRLQIDFFNYMEKQDMILIPTDTQFENSFRNKQTQLNH